MNKRVMSVIAFALLVSAIASFIVYRLISAQLAARAKAPAATRVVVAAHKLEIGTLLKDTDVRLQDWGGPAPPGSLTKVEDVLNRGVVEPMYPGEPILDTRIAAKGAGAGLAATIPQGMRAVAVRVNDVVSVAGFVTPGQRVDILIAGSPPGGSPGLGTLSKTLLQNIQVLSAGQNIQKDAEGKPITVAVVNLLVTPEQAEILSLAGSETRIQLVLRNPTDTETSKTTGTAVAYLFSGTNGKPPVGLPKVASKEGPRRAPAPPKPAPPPPPKAEPPPPPITVEVIHGATKVETKFKSETKSSAEDKKQ